MVYQSLKINDNNFFTIQTSEELLIKRSELIKYLTYEKKFNINYTSNILEAYDFFVENPKDRKGKSNYNGASFVPDLYDFYNLQLSAMWHDYVYIYYRVASNLYYKKLADEQYYQMLIDFAPLVDDFEREDIAKLQLKGLNWSSLPYWIYSNIQFGAMGSERKKKFIEHLNKFKKIKI